MADMKRSGETSLERSLDATFEEIERISAEEVGTEVIEPSLVGLVALIKANLQDRALIAQKFVDLIDSHVDGSIEIVQFCMHEFAWEEVREVLTVKLANENDVRVRTSYQWMLEAFDPDWPDRGIFRSYRS
ncbi:hypothetical protein ACQPW3_35670 [Actinosynnema sp. CA-248983]